MRNLIVVGVALLLAGCSGHAQLVTPPDRPRLAAPDSYSTVLCTPPQDLPEGFMTQQWIERYWSLDRASLADCAARHAELTRFLKERDALIQSLESMK